MTGASSKIDVRSLKVGDLLIEIICTLCISRSSIPCSRSVAISVPVTRQWRHLERIQCVKHGYWKSSTRQSHGMYCKNASGITMRMNKP